MSNKVSLVEVGPRDGLQNEAKLLSLGNKLELVRRLAASGIKRIEAGAFVSPRWVPQMQNTDRLAKRLGRIRSVQLSFLVPNAKGLSRAVDAGAREIAVFTAASESFAQRNTNCSIRESFGRIEEVFSNRPKSMKVRAYISTCFGCPYEGKISEARVVRMAEKLVDLGAYEISIGDTIGVASPKQVKSLLVKLCLKVPPKKIAMHFHDTRGTAISNIVTSLDFGIRAFDASIGGLGGCPYAPGAAGNVSTEDVVYILEKMGFKTGINLDRLIKTNKYVQKLIGHSLPSRVGQVGPPSF